MARFDSTCWTVVLGAASGNLQDRETFSRQYASVIRAYLAARWRIAAVSDYVSDGVQEVLLQLLREHGALERLERDRPGGFRAYLYGVSRNVALTMERKAASRLDAGGALELDPNTVVSDEATLSRVFDGEWIQMIVREARLLLESRAKTGSAAARRLFCLRLRYEEDMKPQEIAERLGQKVQAVYDILKQARLEYRATLFEILASHNPGASEKDLEKTCVDLTGHL